MSFQIAIPQNRRVAGRFVGKVRRALQKALADNPDIKRTDVADAIGVHRSVITRQLSGKRDMSLGRVAELAWALGYEPVFKLEPAVAETGSNVMVSPPPASKMNVQTTTTSGSGVRNVDSKKVELV